MNDSDIAKLDVRSLSLDTLQEILQQLLKLDNVAQIVSGVLTQSPKSGAETQSPLPQKNKQSHISTQLSNTPNVLNDIYLTSLEVELKSAPFELVRNKPSMLFITDLEVLYNNKYHPYPFEAFKDIKRALDITNELTSEAHNGVVIQRIDVNSQLFWTTEDLQLLKKDCPVSKLSVGSNKMLEFCNKKQKGGRCPNHKMEMKTNSVITIPHSVLENCEHRIERPPNKKDKSFKYTLTFITIDTDEANSNSSASHEPVIPIEDSSNTSLAEPSELPNSTQSTEGEQSFSVQPPNGQSLEFSYRDGQKEKVDIANPKCPFIHLKNTPFTKFSYKDINKTTYFSHNFSNRKATYYGEVPYNYTGGNHPPKQMAENGTLIAMESMIAEVFPHYTVNSAMVNQYENGKSFIPYHSDNEEQIVKDSIILTMSFGESRTMQFQNIVDSNEEEEITVMNGDVVLMSMASQHFFKHGIKLDPDCKGPRISITWRLMKSCKSYNSNSLITTNDPKDTFIHNSRISSKQSNNNSVHSHQTNGYNIRDNSQGRKTRGSNHNQNFSPSTQTGNTILLGDSMLSHLSKFSQGSDMKNVINECVGGSKIDDVAQKINSSEFRDSIKFKKVSYVFLCVGTNDLGAGYSLYNILPRYEKLIISIKDIFPNAKINIFNVFPRKIVDYKLTENILRVNNGLYHMCRSLGVIFIKFFYSFLNNGFLNENLYFKDLLHFSNIGLQMVKRCILDSMNNGTHHMPPYDNFV